MYQLRQPTRLPGSGLNIGPPQIPTGHIPAVRLKTEISDTNMDPPQCVQNAMMKQDKKPFTYTPGGINLSEIKSPRMQRRIELNANAQGVGETPRAPQPPTQNLGNLPPSTLAAMRPQPQVQVFPGPPPPPPMQRSMPPPPPPPMQPLPTQKVTAGGETLERPDMTKIIPDNPMALLRKTGGPAPRKSLVDEVYAEQDRAPPSPPQRQYEAQSPRYQAPAAASVSPPAPQRQPQTQYQPPQQQYQPPQPQYQPPQQQYQTPRSPESPKLVGYQPPVIERKEPVQNNQPTKTSTAHLGSLYIPPTYQQQRVVSPPTPPERQQQSVQSPGTPTLKEAPKPWQAKNQQKPEELPPWARRDEPNEKEQVITTQQQSPPVPNKWQPSSQTPPTQALQQQPNQWPNQQQPQTQQRWQPQQQQQPAQQPAQQRWQPQTQPAQPQPQLPAQAKWQPQSPAGQAQPQRQFQSPPPGVIPVRLEIRTNMRPEPQEPEDSHPNAVFVTQPIILQHPGPRIQPPLTGNRQSEPRPQVVQPTPKVDSQGARIIPIHIEGRTPPSTPGTERSLTRQQSWGNNNPTQSNSFKVIQKITQTDDDVDDDTPITHHSARHPQNFQQAPAEQMRKMKLSDGDRDLMNRFKQELLCYDEENPRYRGGHIPSKVFRYLDESGVDEDLLQREADPRYRGAAIPSKAFRMLQKQIGCDSDVQINNPNNPVTSVPQQDVQQQLGRNQSRTIPVQIEGNGHVPNYVHPSEQTVPEPKKYTGSSIPSRSFKILQAMTAPDTCANVNHQEDNPYAINSNPHPYEYIYPPAFYPPPYWHPYYYEQPVPSKSQAKDRESNKSGRSSSFGRATPIPFWPPPTPPPYFPSGKGNESDSNEAGSSSSRDTSIPYWYPSYPTYIPPGNENNKNENQQPYCMYPMPYFDPYYYSYYYGYPTMVPHYPPYYHMDEHSGYSSMDEMGSYSKSSRRRRNSMETESTEKASNYFQRSKSATPRIIVTPTNNQEDFNEEIIKKIEIVSDSESESTETETEEHPANRNYNALQSIRSVPDINVYANEECSEDDETSDSSCDTDNMSVINEEEIIPHQLSIIFEESERADSRIVGSASVMSDSTTIGERSDNEDDIYENINVPIKFTIQVANEKYENISFSLDKNEVRSFEEENFLASCQVVRSNLLNHHQSQDHDDKTSYESMCNGSKIIEHEMCQPINTVESDKESDEDWWSVLGKGDQSPPPIRRNTSKTEEEKVFANEVSKIDQISIDDENFKDVSEESGDLVRRKNNDHGDTRKANSKAQETSVYDILKEDDGKETEITGRIMEMESFVEKLEEIKRNSGLWDNFNIEDNRKKSSKTNKSETDQNDTPINTDISETTNNTDICTISETNDEQPEEIEINTDISETINNTETNDEEPEEIDFWSQIKNDSDDECHPKRRSIYLLAFENNLEKACSTSSLNSSNSSSNDVLRHNEVADKETVSNGTDNINNKNSKGGDMTKQKITERREIDSEEEATTDTESSSSEDEQSTQNLNEQNEINNNDEEENNSKPLTIKERIKALQESVNQKQKNYDDEEEIKVCVKEKISVIGISRGNLSKNTSTKSSVKSFEEYSEEEGDSGVLSDISRHISDSEEFPELKKMTRYERAATHSRLFKLLQEECDNDEDIEDQSDIKEDKFAKLSVRQNSSERKVSPSRSQLSLPLKTCNTIMLEEEGNTSQNVNEKLVNELVQSLLKKKKGQIFRNMPKEKLHAAALKILQEDYMSCGETPEEFSSLLSPLRGDTQSSTPAQTPQEFYGNYNEYKQYYESWGEANFSYTNDNDEILTSKAFRLLREHIESNKIGTIEGLIAKCPRILSSKNVHKELLQLLDGNQRRSNSQSPEKCPKISEVTNTS